MGKLNVTFGTGNALDFNEMGTHVADGVGSDLSNAVLLAEWFTLVTDIADTDGLHFTPTKRLLETGKGRVYVTARKGTAASKPAGDGFGGQGRKAAAATNKISARDAAEQAVVQSLLRYGRDADGQPFTDAASVQAFLQARRDVQTAASDTIRQELADIDAAVADLNTQLRTWADLRKDASERLNACLNTPWA